MEHHHIGQMRFEHQRLVESLEAVVVVGVVGVVRILTIHVAVDRFLQMPTDNQRTGVFLDDVHMVVDLHPLRSLFHVVRQIHHDLARLRAER